MATRSRRAPQTPATVYLKKYRVPYDEHLYPYVEKGGAAHSAAVLGIDPHWVIKTLIMHDDAKRPLIVLMHGDRRVNTKALARQIGVKFVEPCDPAVAQKHSGYLVGGTSPFGTAEPMPVYIESTILDLPKIAVNGGRRGFLVSITPDMLILLLGARPVACALPL